MRKFFTVPLFMIFFFSPGSVDAYVLDGPHILYRTIKKMGKPINLTASQILTIYENDSLNTKNNFQETINYKFPEQFRSDLNTEEMNKIHIFSEYNTLTIINEKISSTSETIFDHYKDLLLFRNRLLLEDRLVFFGVDYSLSSLGRFQNRLFFIIGAKYPDETLPQLWIDKETFLPTRLLLVDRTDSSKESIIEFRYLNWMSTEKTWYPIQIETYVDNNLIRTIMVNIVEVNTDLDENLFNITQLQNTYPPIGPDLYDQKEEDALEDVQQSIEDLKQRFE